MISPYIATTVIMQKHCKFERMRGCNCSSVIEKGSFIEWVAATGIAN